MINYAVCEISGKQYKVVPGQIFEAALQEAGSKEIEVPVLMLSEDNKLMVGKPFLKDKMQLSCIEDTKGIKIRVSKFHAKANYRRNTGYRSRVTKLVWDVEKDS